MSRVRDHWSIGEVLSLLQDEFPEVTISKIRFLESQGLIDPERTASGYRKFADVDYDRLYWILEQQRDHYLPLRVIRDRLEEGQAIGSAPRRSDLRIGDQIADAPESNGAAESGASQDANAARLADGSFSDALADVAGPVTAVPDEAHPIRDEGSNALAAAMGAQTELRDKPVIEEAHPVVSEAPEQDFTATTALYDDAVESAELDLAEVEVVESEVAMTEAEQSTDQLQTELDVVEAVDTAEEAAPENVQQAEEDDRAAAPKWVAPTTVAPDSEPRIITEAVAAKFKKDSDQQRPSEQEGADNVPEPNPAPRLLGTRSEAPRPVSKTTTEALKPPPRPSLPGSSVALTREELAEQSGTTPGMIAELEKYGMVSPRQVGGAVLFDSTALTVARLAVQFGRYGLEPRHLKTFRLGAEREVTLLTQSIGPTLKANNPETRRRSYDTLQDLAELSASLRSIIVRDLVADLEPDG